MGLKRFIVAIVRILNGQTRGSGMSAAKFAESPPGVPSQDLRGVEEPGLATPNHTNGFGE